MIHRPACPPLPQVKRESTAACPFLPSGQMHSRTLQQAIKGEWRVEGRREGGDTRPALTHESPLAASQSVRFIGDIRKWDSRKGLSEFQLADPTQVINFPTFATFMKKYFEDTINCFVRCPSGFLTKEKRPSSLPHLGTVRKPFRGDGFSARRSNLTTSFRRSAAKGYFLSA